jgi:hypothetical protein
MRVFLNDRDVGGLDQGLERRLQGRPNDRVIEAVVWSDAESVRARGRELMLLLFGTAALVVFLFCLNLFIVAVEAPQVVGWVAAAFAGAAIFVAGLVALLYVLMLGAHRRRVEARSTVAQLPAGTTVRLDATGLTVGGRLSAWTALTIDELGVRRRQGSESRVTYIERLVLSDAAGVIPLDALFLGNGRAVLQQAWYRLRAAGR